MKKLYPIITATSLVLIASLAGYHLPATGDRSPVIPVFIPDNTKVSLKNGTSLSGRLIKFDSQAKTIALGRESKTKEVAMKEQNFKIVDVNEGKAEVTLTSLNPRQIGIISDVLRNSSYVVEEIKFNPSDKIEIQVNRCVATYQYGRCYN